MQNMDAMIWILVGLVWLTWYLIGRRRSRPRRPEKIAGFKMLRDQPADLKDSIYHPKAWRKPKR
jgi:hypothetical protein